MRSAQGGGYARKGGGERVRGDGAGTRTAARTHADAVVLGPVDEVGHDEEVAAVALAGDDAELELDPVADLLGERLPGVAALDAAPDLLGQPALLVLALGDVGAGHVAAVGLGELDVAALGDEEGVVTRLLEVVAVLPQLAHLVRGLDVVATPLEPQAVRVGDRLAGGDADERVVGGGVVGVGVVAVVGGHGRQAEVLAQAQEVLTHLALDGDAVVHQLEEEVLLAEDVLEVGGGLARLGVLAEAEPGLDLPRRAPCGGDESLAVALQELAVRARLVVVALEARQRGDAEEVVHALGGGGQHRHVGVGATPGDVLAALLGGVALAPPDLASLAAVGAGRQVGLDADDRLDAVRARLGPEVVGAVQVAVVGHRDGRHAELGRPGEHAVQERVPVEHGVLRVVVQVHEGRVARHRVMRLETGGARQMDTEPAGGARRPIWGRASAYVSGPTRRRRLSGSRPACTDAPTAARTRRGSARPTAACRALGSAATTARTRRARRCCRTARGRPG